MFLSDIIQIACLNLIIEAYLQLSFKNKETKNFKTRNKLFDKFKGKQDTNTMQQYYYKY